ncbi:glycosyltransferase [bacterium]|nr:glycosyltransferase [bacterium]
MPDIGQLPTVSIITVVYNRASTIAAAIESVINQTSDSIEYIVIDGMSNDGTDKVIDQYRDEISRVIREPDSGLYDALNKGIEAASGDVIGFVHADDMLDASDIVASFQEKFASENYDAIYGNLLYVDSEDISKIIRYWTPGEYRRSRFRDGWMPPHPTVFLKRSAYLEHGLYRTDLGSAADYECLIRLLYKSELKTGYLDRIVSRMRIGGESNSSLRNRLNANSLDRKAWLENGYKPPFALRLKKPLSKLPQYFNRPRPR